MYELENGKVVAGPDDVEKCEYAEEPPRISGLKCQRQPRTYLTRDLSAEEEALPKEWFIWADTFVESTDLVEEAEVVCDLEDCDGHRQSECNEIDIGDELAG